MKNHRIVISRHGGPEVLELIEEELPDPSAGEALVRVLGSGAAFGDVLKREGIIPGLPKTPFTPGYDLVGEIVQGNRFRVGQRVVAFVQNGGHSEYVNVSENLLVPIPDGIDPIEALSLVLNYVTAWQLLHRLACVREGESILVEGAAGGVGTALLELARIARVRTYGTASKGKHDLVRQLGGEPIDYKSEDFVVRIHELTDGRGVDAVFDPIGGKHLSRSWKTLRQRGGCLVCYGVSEAVNEPGARRTALLNTVLRLGCYKVFGLGRSVFFYGIGKGPHASQPQIQEDLASLLAMLKAGQVHPIIGARFPLREARQAYELLGRAGTTGKIVLVH